MPPPVCGRGEYPDAGGTCKPCGKDTYQPFTTNAQAACIPCPAAFHVPLSQPGATECLPCPVPICARTVTDCTTTDDTEAVVYDDFTFFVVGEKRCREADRTDPCDADTWCIPAVADCPDHIRLDMLVPTLLPAESPEHATIYSRTTDRGDEFVYTVRAPHRPAACGAKVVTPRYQFLFTRCDASSDVGCSDRCFTLLLGQQNGITRPMAEEFADRAGIRATVRRPP